MSCEHLLMPKSCDLCEPTKTESGDKLVKNPPSKAQLNLHVQWWSSMKVFEWGECAVPDDPEEQKLCTGFKESSMEKPKEDSKNP